MRSAPASPSFALPLNRHSLACFTIRTPDASSTDRQYTIWTAFRRAMYLEAVAKIIMMIAVRVVGFSFGSGGLQEISVAAIPSNNCGNNFRLQAHAADADNASAADGGLVRSTTSGDARLAFISNWSIRMSTWCERRSSHYGKFNLKKLYHLLPQKYTDTPHK